MFEFQVMGMVVLGALLLILLIFVMLEMHSNRIVDRIWDNAQLLKPELFLTEPNEKIETASDNDSIPDMDRLPQALNETMTDQIDTVVRLTFDRKTNRLMVDSATVVRFMLCIVLMKFNKLDNKSVVRNIMVWLTDKMFSPGRTKLTANNNVG